MPTNSNYLVLRNSFKTYQIKRRWNGRFGEIYIVLCIEDQSLYAVKTIGNEIYKKNRIAMTQFMQEAKLLMNLKAHRNILKPIMIDQLGDGKVCILMDYFPRSLRDLIAYGPNHTVNEVIRYCLQIANALHYLHESEAIVHRDLKPENIMVTSDLTLKLTDFGMCYWLGFGGSLPYMSPEQHSSQNRDKRSDVYAFGIIAFELLAKRLPYPDVILDNNSSDDFYRFKNSERFKEVIETLSIKAPQQLVDLISWCLALDIDTRVCDFKKINEVLHNLSF